MSYTEEDAERIYSAAIAAWGIASQLLMAIEEMAELIQAICKDFRGKADYDNIAEAYTILDLLGLPYADFTHYFPPERDPRHGAPAGARERVRRGHNAAHHSLQRLPVCNMPMAGH